MSKIERQFSYQAPVEILTVLGVLMIILGPATMWVSLQAGDPNAELMLIGKGMFFTLHGVAATWGTRVLAIALIGIGVMMILGANQAKRSGGRVAFTSTGLIFEAGPPDGIDREIPYANISDVKTEDYRGQRRVTFENRGGRGHCCILASQMKSQGEFEEMAALLTERVKASTTL